MDVAIWFRSIATVVSLLFGLNVQHCGGNMREFKNKCDYPSLTMDKHLIVHEQLDGFNQTRLKAIYNTLSNRTEFLSVTLDRRFMARGPHQRCPNHRWSIGALHPDDVGFLVPRILGGSCTVVNLFVQSIDCSVTVWPLYVWWVTDAVLVYERVKYCVRLLYNQNEPREWRPYKVVSHVYSDPENILLNKIVLDNPPDYDMCTLLTPKTHLKPNFASLPPY